MTPTPDLPILSDAKAELSLPEATLVKSAKGTAKKRFGSLSAACRLLDCEPLKMRTILRTGLIYAYKGTEYEKSWWRIDLVGLYLYRDNQRRRAISLLPSPAWRDYSAHMVALNKGSLQDGGPPVI